MSTPAAARFGRCRRRGKTLAGATPAHPEPVEGPLPTPKASGFGPPKRPVIVLPARAGIQTFRPKASLPMPGIFRIMDSGFLRNDGSGPESKGPIQGVEELLNKPVTWVFIPTRRSCESRNLGPQRFRFLPSQERRGQGLSIVPGKLLRMSGVLSGPSISNGNPVRVSRSNHKLRVSGATPALLLLTGPGAKGCVSFQDRIFFVILPLAVCLTLQEVG